MLWTTELRDAENLESVLDRLAVFRRGQLRGAALLSLRLFALAFAGLLFAAVVIVLDAFDLLQPVRHRLLWLLVVSLKQVLDNLFRDIHALTTRVKMADGEGFQPPLV